MKTNNLKKFIAIFTAVALVCVMLPLSVGATGLEDVFPTSQIRAHFGMFIRAGFMQPQPGSGHLQVDTVGGNHRQGFITFDLSSIMSDPNAEIQDVTLRMTVNQAITTGDFGFFILPQEMEHYDQFLIYRTAQERGMISDTSNLAYSRTLIGHNTATPSNPASLHPQYTGDIWPAIQQHFLLYPQDYIITIRISTIGTGPGTFVFNGWSRGDESPTLIINYQTADSVIVNQAVPEFTFDNLSTEDRQNVTRPLTLPTIAQDGATRVNWLSTNEVILNSNTGAVSRPAFGQPDALIELDARISHGTFSRDLRYEVTVLSRRDDPMFAPDTIASADSAYVSQAQPNVVMNNRSLMGNSGANEQVSFVSFDFSAYRARMNDLDTAMIRLIPINGDINGENNVNLSVNMLPAGTTIDSNTLTYANAAGFLTGGTEVDTFSGTLGETPIFYTDNLMPALRNHFATNPASNIITFRVESTNGVFAFHGIGAESEDIRPALAMITNQNALRESVNFLTFDKISPEVISRVRQPLDLISEGLFSVGIEWASSNPGVINPTTGAVTRLENDTTVTLTATLSNAGLTDTVTFNVTVLGTRNEAPHFHNLLNSINFPVPIVTTDFAVPSSLEQVPIIWTTDESHVMRYDNGMMRITRLNSREMEVRVTATITDGNVTANRIFNFFVIRNPVNDALLRKRIVHETGDERYAIDDNMDTYWEIGARRTLTIDTGASRSFREFLLVTTTGQASGVRIRSSIDGHIWRDVMTSGVITPNALNHLTLEQPIFTRFVEFTFPAGINGVRFLGGYANPSIQPAGMFDGIEIPDPITGDFRLPQTTRSGDLITWVSNNTDVVRVDGEWARVTRPTANDVRITMNLSATDADGEVHRATRSSNVLRQSGQQPGPGPGPGGGGGGFGGPPTSNVTMPNNPIVLPETDPGLIPPQYGDVFVDLDEAAWARDYIMSLYNSRIIFGRDEGIFAPNGTLLREEMAALIVRAFELSADDAGVDFSDVNSWDWFYDAVRAMYANGITQGMGNGEYGVGLNISRQHAVLLIKRVLETAGVELAAVSEQLFVDDEAIADYAREAVYTLRAMGIIGGDENGNFNPTNSISRAEISRILYSALALL